MDEFYRSSLLFDCYGTLLTGKQREIFRLHVQEDWSLSEIAEALSISRQGVSDALRRGKEVMESYDGKLRLVKLMLEQKAFREKLTALCEKLPEEAEKEELKSLIENMPALEHE